MPLSRRRARSATLTTMGRPGRYTRDDVAAAALAIVDERGPEGLSMRSLAAALGTGPMTLYNYVPDRAALDEMVVDAVLRDVRWSGVPHPSWRDDVHEIAAAVWRAVRPHPRVVPLVLSRRSRTAVFLDVAEALLGALRRAGLTDGELLVAFRVVSTFVMGMTQAEITGPLAGTGGERPEDVLDRFQQLAPDRYPGLVEIARAAATSEPDAELRRGLDVILDGLEERT